METAVVICLCPFSHKKYGVRFEKIDGKWNYTWAFPIKESSVKREGYDGNYIEGDIYPASSYPGCPYCGCKNFILCGCGHLSCYNSPDKAIFKCDWCGNEGEVTSWGNGGFGSSQDI